MSDFDPNHELDTQHQADAYVRWCAENLMRLCVDDVRTYRTGVRAAAWLLVCATAELHLDETWTRDREALLEQLVAYSQLARALERQREHLSVERLIVLRASLDCWEPAGALADQLLIAARTAVAALILIEVCPLVDLWDVAAHDVWALIEYGWVCLRVVDHPETFADYAVRPDERVTARYTWQRANHLTRRIGADPLSPN